MSVGIHYFTTVHKFAMLFLAAPVSWQTGVLCCLLKPSYASVHLRSSDSILSWGSFCVSLLAEMNEDKETGCELSAKCYAGITFLSVYLHTHTQACA